MSEVPLHGRSMLAIGHLKITKGISCRSPTPYRGTSLIRNTPHLGPYSSPTLRDLW